MPRSARPISSCIGRLSWGLVGLSNGASPLAGALLRLCSMSLSPARERKGACPSRINTCERWSLVRLRVEHSDDELDGAARREVLAAITTQVGPNDLLVGSCSHPP